MKQFKLLGGLNLIFLLLAFWFVPAAVAQSTQNFSFESFNADYYLDRDSEHATTLTVKETLVAVFPSYDQNHGILRAIPQTYKNHTLSLKGVNVTDENGNPQPFTSSKENDNKVLKIGDANTYVHGRKIYKISYKMQDVASFYSDHDEFFWDINGDQWPQSFASVTARIHISQNLVSALQERQLCYKGHFGSKAQDCEIKRQVNSEETFITTTASNLAPYETLSAALGFKPNTFIKKSSAIKKAEQAHRLKLIANGGVAIIAPLFSGIFIFRRWRQFGDDPKGRGVIIPEYEPPKGFDVLNSDYLLEQKLRNKAISAMLIEQAVKRNIIIYEIPKKGLFGKKDYELELGSIPPQIPQETKDTLAAIFDDNLTQGTRAKISSFKKGSSKQTTIYIALKKLEKSLAAGLYKGGYFRKNPRSVRNGYRTWATIFFTFGWVLLFALSIAWGLAAGMILSGIIIFFFSFFMSARTEFGVAAHDALLGLKDYIKLAEADRLKFLQSPDGAEKLPVAEQFDPKTPQAKVKLFEKLLPYAMLFGLEKDWAKQFESIYTTPPDWYHGNWSTFNTYYLASSLSNFSSASSPSFATPSSSSSSGFSGGGSGGGGGGGGGGGW